MIPLDQLPTFLADLQSSGFSIGLPERERILDLLLQLELSGTMPQSSNRLCNMLGPVLCNSAEQQAHFHRRFLSYFGELRPSRGGDLRPHAALMTDEPPEADLGFWDLLSAAERQMIMRLLIVTTAALLVSIGVPEILLLLGWLPQPTATLPSLLSFLHNVMHAPTIAWRTTGDAFGVWTLFIALPIFALAGFWTVSPGRSFTAYLRRRRLDFRPEFVRLLVRGVSPNPFHTREAYRDIQLLRRPRLVDSSELDVEASLSATLEHAGLFTPKLARRPVAPEHLFVIERRSEHDHVAQLAEQFIQLLREAQVFVEVYWFADDVRRLSRSDDMPAASFDEVASRHVDHRLILVTSGECFFDPASGSLQNWAQAICSFERRVLLTPTPRKLWGYREQALHAGLQISVLPLHPDALHEATAVLAADEALAPRPPTPASRQDAPALMEMMDLLDERPVRWSEAWTPEIEQQAALQQALQKGLEPKEHAWLAACAVYPELNWNLTLHLGNAMFEASRGGILADRVLDLANLPWFRSGRLPTWLRQRLTEGMPADLYWRVRNILGRLLLTVLGRAQRNLAFEVGLRHGGQVFQDLSDQLSAQMEDPVLVDFMTRRGRDRTALRLPRMLARLIAGGLLRNMFSREQLEDLGAAGQMVDGWVQEQNIVTIGTTRSPALGAEFRLLTDIANNTGNSSTPAEPLYLFLPTGNKPGRLVDEASVVLYHYRRRITWILSLLNIGVVLLAALTLYSHFYETTQLAFTIVVLWLISPFALLYFILVRPVTRRFLLFPGFVPETAPRHLSARFRRLAAEPTPTTHPPEAAGKASQPAEGVNELASEGAASAPPPATLA